MPGRTNHRVGLALPNQYARLWAQHHQQPTLKTPGPHNQSRPPLPQCRMQFPQSLLTRRYENGGISTVRVQNLKYLEGNCMRNLSPADERWPQGLRTHIHTLTVSALNSTSTAKLSLHAFLAISPVQNSPNSPPLNSTSETKFALLPENGPFLGILALQGEFCLADTEKMTSRANFVSPRGQALDCWANFRTQQRWTNDHPRTGCRSSWHTAAPGKLARNSLTRTFNKR